MLAENQSYKEFSMEIREMKEQTTMCINAVTPVEKISEVFGTGYGELMQEAAKAGVAPAGPPYALYLNDDMSNLEIEFGFPVAPSDQDKVKKLGGRVQAGTLPGGKTAVVLHEGPYDSIGDSYNKLTGFISDRGMEPTGLCYEYYLNDPREAAPEELKTEIYFPLKN